MYYLNSICFVCLNSKTKLSAVFLKEKHNEIFIEVKYALPELTILDPENPVYICSSCHRTLRSFSMFKKKCLENYSRLNNYRNILQGSNAILDQSSSELQIRVIKCELPVKRDNDMHLNITIENGDALLLWEEQLGQKTDIDDNVEIKEESLASEDSADRAFYQQVVKSESVSDDELDGGSSVTSEDNNALDKDETNFNANTDSQHFQCLLCNEVFTDRLKFDTHFRNHINNITDFKCLICNKKCSRKSYLKYHMIAHLSLKDYECTICKKKFTSSRILKCHLNIHKGKNYKCSICKKKFTTNGNLKRHLKIHLGIKVYECAICKKKFMRFNHLIDHMKIHLAIKDFECTICKKKFILNCNLKKHLKIHAGIKNYECSICAKRFARNHHLKRHVAIHNKR